MYSIPCFWVSLVLCATCTGVKGVDNKTPKCDPSVTAKAMKIPTDALEKFVKQGSYSYTLISPENMEVNDQMALCVGVTLPDTKTARVVKKIPGAQTPHEEIYNVENKGDYLLYTPKDGQKTTYKLHIFYDKDGVVFTYKCCDECTGTTAGVGIAVADKMSKDDKTQVALKEATAKAKQMKMDSHFKNLNKC